jgi:tripartite-type tricarboxylate transporter receptor subunit TctC
MGRTTVLARLCTLGIAVAVLGAAPAAIAQDFPARPITLVVPYAAGGGTDIVARKVGQRLGEILGKPVVIENRPGAGSITGAAAVAKAAPDGYTLLFATVTTLAIQPNVHRKLPYDPAKDFIPVGMVAGTPFVLTVTPKLPIRTVAELIAYAKRHPGELTFASGGFGTPHHLFGELLKNTAGIAMDHVPFTGSGQALPAAMGGHVSMIFSDVPPALPLIRENKLTALGVATKERIEAAPELPTLAESGLAGMDALGWLMLVAPAQTPAAVIDRLNGALRDVMAEPEVRKQILDLALVPVPYLTPAQAQDYVASETRRWGEIVKLSGARVD